jgi:phosphoribosylformylglycinamidine synthase subunit PurQ / glutaminase
MTPTDTDSNDLSPYYSSSPEEWFKLKLRTRELRHESTEAEKQLWQAIRNRTVEGAKFRRQHTIGPFVVDFICMESRLILEVDGTVHDQPDQRDYDEARQQYLEGHGYRVIRFKNAAVLETLETVVDQIRLALKK